MRYPIILLAFTSIAATSLSAQTKSVAPPISDSALAARVAGCYVLVDDGWQADSDMAKFVSPLPQAPVRFEVMSNPDSRYAQLSAYDHVTYYEVRGDSVPGWDAPPFQTWTRVSETGTTIDVWYPLPTGGLELRVAPQDGNLVGRIIASTDALPMHGPSSASHTVTAQRIACR